MAKPSKKPSKIVPRAAMLARIQSRPTPDKGAVTPSRPAAIAQLPVERAAAILATCVKVDEVRDVRDRAEAIATYTRRKIGGEAASRDAEAIVEHAERRLGELLAGQRVKKGRPAEKATPMSPPPAPVTPATRTATKTKQRAEQRSVARSKAKAKVPARRFETTIGEALAAGKSPKKAVAELIAKPPKPKPVEAVEAPKAKPSEATWAQPLPSDGWDERAAVVQVCREMEEALDVWPSADTVDVVTVRKALARWQGLIRG